jgi:hypothetical protein
MKQVRFLARWFSPSECLLLLGLVSFCHAADPPFTLTVRDSGSYLYSRQEIESDKLAPLQKGETLVPLAEAVGNETWYMVKTQQGLFGWVRAADVSGGDRLKEAFTEEQPVSTWTARSANGRTLEGDWTAEPGSSADKVSGTWTLRDGANKVILRGTWFAQKFSTGWSGVWRGAVEGQRNEYAGSWTADFSHARESPLVELFEAAARNAIRGVWNAGKESGSWSIKAAK